MVSPVSRLKRRVGASIQLRLDSAVDSRLTSVLASIHGLSLQMNRTAVSVADWQQDSNRTIQDMARALEEIRMSVHQLVSSTEQEGAPENAATLKSLNLVESRFADLAGAINKLEHDLKVLSSQVRTRPYGTDNAVGRIEIDGHHVIGFDTSNGSTFGGLVDSWRPNEDIIKEQLRRYARWLPASGNALDLGCGRGEMLSVLSEIGLTPFGVDNDPEVVDLAHQSGFNAVVAEVGNFLRSVDNSSVSVVTAIHLCEHADILALRDWLSEIHRSLVNGGTLIIETPNPNAIDAFKAFWLDVTHVRPYYPEALILEVGKAGFSKGFVCVDGDVADTDTLLGTSASYSIVAFK